jgi:hypothetical protein
MTFPSTLADIRQKVRRITGRPSAAQITDSEIDNYINTYYHFDLPMNLKMESLRYVYEFNTRPNIAVYDMPVNSYLDVMPPVYIGGYQSYMTQSRENFFRVNPQLNLLQQSIATGDGGTTYTGTLNQTPIVPGFKPNPPGAYSVSIAGNDLAASDLKWNVIISASGTPDVTSGIAPDITLVDDGHGNLFSPTDTSTQPASNRGTINYITGAVNITNMPAAVPTGNAINAQYIPYVASRPQSVVFFQDQFIFYPIPDQAYTVSFEVYKYPTSLASDQPSNSPQLQEWWQLLAYGAADKIFADNANFDDLQKFRPLLQEQMNLVERRTIVQQTSERTATIYTEQTQFPAYPNNPYSGGL